ncbi:MAG: flagellar motor switch protein FliG [Rhodomicrobium sp.]|nr:MAG: flagellar motor switch protein FliG [Rhodomicrobium sp.]
MEQSQALQNWNTDKNNTAIASLQAEVPTAKLSGEERSAILLLALGKDFGEPIWESLDDEEIAEISIAMSKLGKVTTTQVEDILARFISDMSISGAVMGNFESTESLLKQILPEDRVNLIMEGIRGPAGRNMWEKLSNVQAHILANYLKNEYPQTIAVILSKISPDHAARVLSLLPDDFSLEVIQRMLAMEAVQKEILEKIENTLRREFISNLSSTNRTDAHETMASIFNNFDRQTEALFMGKLEDVDRDAAERIKTLMFTFDDLGNLDGSSLQTLIRAMDNDVIALAIKGTSDKIKDLFLSNMSQRAAALLRDELENMGPVRLSDVDEAQMTMINKAKDLEAAGDIVLAKDGAEDEFI